MNPTVSNLLEIIENHAADHPEKHAVTFDDDPPCTYGALSRGINRVGARLLRKGIKPGDRILVAVPNSIEFLFAFYGILKAGGTAVPVSPNSGSERIMNFARLSNAALILTSRRFPNDITRQLPEDSWEYPLDKTIIRADIETGSDITPDGPFPVIRPEDIAFIQFTSGSTGDPKGVRISHARLMINIMQMIEGMQITPKDIFVSWLPVFHDMGLILMTMVPLFIGSPFFLLPIGIRHLEKWLRTIEAEKATFTAAPDFMYRLSLLYIRDPDRYDLSTLRTALNAAEPVRASTISAFEKQFRLNNVLLPAYGLAEATVGVSCWYPGKPVKVDEKGHVSVGKPFPGIDIRIDRENIPVPDKELGEILVHSPANTGGYYRNPAADDLLFTKDRYIRTGDLGYLDKDGDLTVVGRKKNIIIQGGMNISAREVEELTDSFPFVRRSAAAGIDRGKTEGEQVYIFLEAKFTDTQWKDTGLLAEKKIDIVNAFRHRFGFRPGRIIFLEPRSIPMTQNGKTQYTKLIEQFLSGTFRKQGRDNN